MKLDWLGEYRAFVGQLFRFANIYAMSFNNVQNGNSINATALHSYSALQIQIVECILENENENLNMSEVAQRIGVTRGTLTKNAAQLVEKGFIEKYRASNNSKNIILRATDCGRKAYEDYTESAYELFMRDVFTYLDEIPPEYISRFTDLLDASSKNIKKSTEPTIYKIE